MTYTEQQALEDVQGVHWFWWLFWLVVFWPALLFVILTHTDRRKRAVAYFSNK